MNRVHQLKQGLTPRALWNRSRDAHCHRSAVSVAMVSNVRGGGVGGCSPHDVRRWNSFEARQTRALSFGATKHLPNRQARSDSPADISYWNDRWKENKTPFHCSDVHHSLLKWGHKVIPNFSVPPEDGPQSGFAGNPVRVFLPLCGRSVDMAFLARETGVSEVIGLEGVRQALDEFAAENPWLEIHKVENSPGPFNVYRGKKITLLEGDFFELEEANCGGRFDVVWDRASLVAIPPDLREKYVAVLAKVTKPGGVILLSSLDRRTGTAEAIASGPPFSVNDDEVQRLFATQPWVKSVTKMEEIDEMDRDPEFGKLFLAAGVTSLFEGIFIVQASELQSRL